MKTLNLILTCMLMACTSTFAIMDGQADHQVDDLGYYYMITGGKFPTGNIPNGNNGSGGTFRFLLDEPAWGSYPLGQWNKDDWFPENASYALTLKNQNAIVYDNCGIEDGSYGDYYDATAQGVNSADAPGLYRGYSMSNNYDWIYAGYFKLEQNTTIDTMIGYFDANAGFDPSNPLIGFRFNIWSGVQDDPDNNPNSWMPSVNSFTGNILSSDTTSGTLAWSDTGVDRVFGADYGSATDDILRLSFTLDQAITLPAGVYFFSHDATIPEPMTMALLGLGGLFLRKRK